MTYLAEAILAVEAAFPNARWSIGKPADWADGFPVKFRRKKPYEAWVVDGEFGRKGFISVPGDGETPADAVCAALEAALKEKEKYDAAAKEAKNSRRT